MNSHIKTIALCILLLIAGGTAQSSDEPVLTVDRHRMNLGGASGQYTDWERSGIEHFVGVNATIEIEKTHGRPRDKWAALARVNLYGRKDAAGDAEWLSVALQANRRNGQIIAIFYNIDTKEPNYLEFSGAVGRPIALSMQIRPGQILELTLDDSHFTVELPPHFLVESVVAVGSGVDVSFNPFEILYKQEKGARRPASSHPSGGSREGNWLSQEPRSQ